MEAMEEGDTEEAAEAMAEEVVEVMVAAGVEAAVAVATEDHAGKKDRSLTFAYYSAGLARRHGDSNFTGSPFDGNKSAPGQERI